MSCVAANSVDRAPWAGSCIAKRPMKSMIDPSMRSVTEQVRPDHAWVDGHGTHARSAGTESALQLEGEQQVRELAVAVRLARVVRPRMPVQIVEVELPTCVGVRCDRDDPAGDVRQQQVGQDEVAEMVRSDLAFEAVGCSRFRDQHDPGVVDEDVDGARPRGREGSNRCEVLQVQQPDFGVARHRRRDALALGRIADGQNDLRAGPSQRASAGRTDAARGAGHHDDRAGHDQGVRWSPRCAFAMVRLRS